MTRRANAPLRALAGLGTLVLGGTTTTIATGLALPIGATVTGAALWRMPDRSTMNEGARRG